MSSTFMIAHTLVNAATSLTTRQRHQLPKDVY